MAPLSGVSLTLALAVMLSVSGSNGQLNTAIGTSDLIFAKTSDIIRLRGFQATDYTFTTSDGYILNVVRISNPLIGVPSADKDPVLFVHGILVTANYFVMNSVGGGPKDYSNIDAGSLSQSSLEALIGNDLTTNSLALTLANFGYDVWLLNRRGGPQSRGHTVYGSGEGVDTSIISELSPLDLNLTSSSLLDTLSPYIDPRNVYGPYWNYSLDEQAKYDIPEAIDFVLTVTNRSKLVYVGHSAGTVLNLMAQIVNPSLANKLSKSVLLAGALTVALDGNLVYGALSTLIPVLSEYLGPVPPAPTVPALKLALASGALMMNPAVAFFDIAMYGYNGFPLVQNVLLPGFEGNQLDTSSSHELVAFLQTYINGSVLHYYDYKDPRRNLIAYGQITPPAYDASKIISDTISLWYGNADSLFGKTDIDHLVKSLSVPVEVHALNDAGSYYNHISFLLHENVAIKLNIPLLKTIGS